MPKEVPAAISNSIEPLFIAATVVSIFALFTVLIRFTPHPSVHDLIYSVLQKPLEWASGSIGTLLFICFIAEGFWWFGIHGSNVTSAIIKTIYTPLALANMEAVLVGAAPTFILNEFFYNIYKGPRHLALGLMLLFIARSKHLNSIGKISVVPGFFGISEPMKFGIPMILNPLLLIPMSLAPVVSILVAYIASIIGFIQPVAVNIPRIMPLFISGFIANGWEGVVVQIIQFAIAIVMYFPFIKILDKRHLEEEMSGINE